MRRVAMFDVAIAVGRLLGCTVDVIAIDVMPLPSMWCIAISNTAMLSG